jgi:transposase InsO family protein
MLPAGRRHLGQPGFNGLGSDTKGPRAIHDYIEIWHNTRRRHSALNMLTPTEYENQHLQPQIAA